MSRRSSAASQSASTSSNPATPAKQPVSVPYGDISTKAAYHPIFISNKSKSGTKRLFNLQLRLSSPEEDALFASRVVKGKQTFFVEGDLAIEERLYIPADSCMLDFDISRQKGLIPCSGRLSCCTARGDGTIFRILQTSLRRVERRSISVKLPEGLQLDAVNFPAGPGGSGQRWTATSARLFVDDTVAEESFSIQSAKITDLTCKATYSEWIYGVGYGPPTIISKDEALTGGHSYSLKFTSLPAGGHGDLSWRQLQWRQLEGLDTAFPDTLYGRDQATIDEWLGGKDAKGRMINFELRDVRINLRGALLGARLIKVAGPRHVRPLKPTPPTPESTSPTPEPMRVELSGQSARSGAHAAAANKTVKKGRFGRFSS